MAELKNEIMSDTELDQVAGGTQAEVRKVFDVLYPALKKEGVIKQDSKGKRTLDVSDLQIFMKNEMSIVADFGVNDLTDQKVATFTSLDGKTTYDFASIIKKCQDFAKTYA